MKARNVMVSPVITANASSTVQEVAKLFIENRISAVPVVDDQGKMIGIVSEGDLMHRSEAGTRRRHSWWLMAMISNETLANEYVMANARRVTDIMTRKVITAAPDTPVHEIAALLEKHAIKRVPIVKDGQIVGIVSRANLIQAIAGNRKTFEIPVADAAIRDRILAHLRTQPWAHTSLMNITVNDGVVDLWGLTWSDAEKTAIRVAAESAAGVRGVNDHLSTGPIASWG